MEDFVKGTELDRLATVVSRQIDQGFAGVDTRITELGERFGRFEDSVTLTLREHGEKIAVLTERSAKPLMLVPQELPEPEDTMPFRKRVAFYSKVGTAVGTGGLFVWSVVKAIIGGGGHK
jgi:hypothetical protein